MYFLIFERARKKIYVVYGKDSNVFWIKNGNWLTELPRNYTGVPIPDNVIQLFPKAPLPEKCCSLAARTVSSSRFQYL